MVLGTNQATSRTFDNNSLKSDIILDDTKLERVNKTKFLGVIIDENLTWQEHIINISKNISEGIGVVNKLKYFAPE